MRAHAGFLLGSRETLLETKDGGRTWEPRSVAAAKDEGARRCFDRWLFPADLALF